MQFKFAADNYFIVLDKGESLFDSLYELCRSQKITSAHLSGIGAISDFSLGYFDCVEKIYQSKQYDEEYELLSLQGNISTLDGNPFAHLHATVSGSDYQVIGGHLFSAKIAITCELQLTKLPFKMERLQNSEIGLNLIKF